MSRGMKYIAAAATLCGSMTGCIDPHCPKGYDKIDDTCYRKKDAGALDAGDEEDATPQGDAHEGRDHIEPETEAGADTGDEGADAGREGADAGREGEGAGVTTSGDAATPCIASAEVCDGKDNDCDGRVDEDTQAWYCDADGDGFAANADSKMDSCQKPVASAACSGWTTTAPSGANAQDCDDDTARRFPGAGFGLAVTASGDLNCDGQTETRLEFVASRIPGYYSSTTPLNICQHTAGEVIGGDTGECDCWFSTAIGEGFVGFDDGGAAFDGSGGSGPYFMRTFPCSEQLGDVIVLGRVETLGGICEQVSGGIVAVRQLCR